MRTATAIELGDQQRTELLRLSRGQKVSVRLAQRAQIILLAVDGLQNLQIADRLGVSRFKVSRWRECYATLGLAGIEQDAPRPGRTPKVSAEQRRQIVRMKLEEKPANAAHWSRERMAEAATVSASTLVASGASTDSSRTGSRPSSFPTTSASWKCSKILWACI